MLTWTYIFCLSLGVYRRQASSADMATDGDEAAATTTPAQCMAAGQRILQVFAAKMVEEKVLTAFREQQALEKQEQLIMEEAEQKRALLERTQAKEKAKLKNRQQQQQQRQAELEEKRRLEEAQVLAEEANRLQREERERFHEAEREQRRQADALRMQQLELEQQKKMMQEVGLASVCGSAFDTGNSVLLNCRINCFIHCVTRGYEGQKKKKWPVKPRRKRRARREKKKEGQWQQLL